MTSLGEGVEVERLSRDDWRAVVAGATTDSRRIVGFIERMDRHRYEVLWLSEPPCWAYVDSLKSAVDAIVNTLRFSGTIESTRVPIVGRPPMLPFFFPTTATPRSVRQSGNAKLNPG